MIEGKSAVATIDPVIGQAPVIDGIIDGSIDEWEEVTPVSIELYQNISIPENGLPIEIKILQHGNFLYIYVQFELEPIDFKDDQFLGILVSTSESEDEDDFFDAKIVQFSNITTGELEYNDYYINNSVYFEDDDSIINGNGAANLENNRMTYEFSLPVKDYNNTVYDQLLEAQTSYAFKIVFGNNPSYPEGISHQNIVIINVKFPPEEPEPFNIELLYFVLSIIIFGSIGSIFGFYLYKIATLKQEIKRMRG
ncbi:MAG: hypothetical protein ACFE85_09500 [Candidatus Hodarchaeota archaeon]